MFNSGHLIWQWADYWDELDDWLPCAGDFVREWTVQPPNQIKFRSQFELRVACFLLYDDLLPESAVKALSMLVLDAMTEAREKGYRLDYFHVIPENRGRKRDQARFFRQRELRELLEAGAPKMEAYQRIADKYSKSTDTIRREYERSQRPKTGRGKS